MVGRPRSVGLFAKHEPTVTGTARYARALARDLATLGWDVTLQTSRPPWPPVVARALARAGVDLTAFWASYPPLPSRARGALLHLTSQTVATSLALVPSSRPTVVTVHDVLPLTLQGDPRFDTLRHPLDAACYRAAMAGIRRADLVLADSQYTADELERVVRIADSRIRVVPLGVDRSRFTTPTPSSPSPDRGTDAAPTVIYVGSEDPRKNLVELLRAVERLRPTYPRLRLLKVGAAHHLDERRRLRELADQLGIASQIDWLDHVPESELVELYRSATVCVIPSLYEGFGLPVLEAMACGTPVVCSNRTSLPEVAGDAAVLVEPTGDGLAGGIRRVLTEAGLRQELSHRGLRRAEQYTWLRTAELTAQAYGELRAACGNS